MFTLQNFVKRQDITIAWVDVKDAFSRGPHSVGNFPVVSRITVCGCDCDDSTACWEVLCYSHLNSDTQGRYGHVQ